jgi:hypothetical protein
LLDRGERPNRQYDPLSHEHCPARVRSQRELSDRGVAAFFGAFAADALVSILGVVRCDATARYQSVSTEIEHRRQGLPRLGRGAGRQLGCNRWVITEATNPAGRVYRGVGFESTTPNAQASAAAAVTHDPQSRTMRRRARLRPPAARAAG